MTVKFPRKPGFGTNAILLNGFVILGLLSIAITWVWSRVDPEIEPAHIAEGTPSDESPKDASDESNLNGLSAGFVTGRDSIEPASVERSFSHTASHADVVVPVAKNNRGTEIHGRVTWLGEPVQASVYYVGPDGKAAQISTDAGGQYFLANRKAGEWRILFATERVPNFKRRVLELDARMLEPAESKRWDFEFFPEGTDSLSGQVVFENEQVVAGAEVRVTNYLGAVRLLTSTTDELGRFQFAVPKGQAGQWSIRATVGVSRASIHRLSSPQENLLVRVPTLGPLDIRLVDFESGNVVPPSWIKWRKSGTKFWGAWDEELIPDESGVVRLELPVGSVELNVAVGIPNYLSTNAVGLEVQTHQLPVVELTMRRGIRLAIEYRSDQDVPGLPLEGGVGHPHLSGPDNTGQSVPTGKAGQVLVGPLRSGTYEFKYFFDVEDVFEFDPPKIDLSAELDQSVVVTWRVADQEAYSKLLLRIEETKRMMQENPGLICIE